MVLCANVICSTYICFKHRDCGGFLTGFHDAGKVWATDQLTALMMTVGFFCLVRMVAENCERFANPLICMKVFV